MVAEKLPNALDGGLWCIDFSWQEGSLATTIYLNGECWVDATNPNTTTTDSQQTTVSSSSTSPFPPILQTYFQSSSPELHGAQSQCQSQQKQSKTQGKAAPLATWCFTRDSLASELIYFAECQSGLFVANDLITLRRLSGLQQANVQWLLNFFTFSDDFSNDTPFQGVETVPSLACLLVDAQGHRVQRDVLSATVEQTRTSAQDMATWSSQQWVAEWRQRTQSAVQQSVVGIRNGVKGGIETNIKTAENKDSAGEKVAIMLSSGLDSAGIAAHLAALDEPLIIKAFSWRFPNHPQANESAAIQALVKHLQGSAKVDLQFIDVLHSDCFAEVDSWPVNLHVPHFNAMRRLKHRLYEAAAEQGCTVLLNGHIGDELCFVDRYILVELWRDNKMACIKQIVQLCKSSVGSIRRNSALRLLCKQWLRKCYDKFLYKLTRKPLHNSQYGSWQQAVKTPPKRLSAAAQALFVQQSASDSLQQTEQAVAQQLAVGSEQTLRPEQFALLLANSELNAMAAEPAFTDVYNIERRHPYLNPELIDLALRTPAYLLSTLQQPKWIARQALAGMLPEKILSRSRTGQLDALFNEGLSENCATVRQYLFRDERQWPQFIDEKEVNDVFEQQDWQRAPAVLVPCLGLERWLDEWRAIGLPVIIQLS